MRSQKSNIKQVTYLVNTRLFLLLLLSIICSSAVGQKKFSSHFIQLNGVNVHYLDFGGEGLPVVLLHSESRNAYSYKDFGPLLTENHHIFAFTRPGYGDSEKGRYDIPGQGDYLIAFINALNIEKAIFMGNSSSSLIMTYLAENYPDRVAGLAYFSGLAVPFLDAHLKDSTRAYEMYSRAAPGADNREEIMYARRTYQPKHLTDKSIKINIPALVFIPHGGPFTTETGTAALLFAGSPLVEDIRNAFPPSGLKDFLIRLANDQKFRDDQMNNIEDSVARAYFTKLANDIEAQRKVYDYYKAHIQPAEQAAKEAFVEALGENLQFVRLNIAEVSGYEYRDNPDLIIDHIKVFLKQVSDKK